jgi:hypothetical protein
MNGFGFSSSFSEQYIYSRPVVLVPHQESKQASWPHFSLLSPLRPSVLGYTHQEFQPRLRFTQKHKPSHSIKAKETWSRVVN